MLHGWQVPLPSYHHCNTNGVGRQQWWVTKDDVLHGTGHPSHPLLCHSIVNVIFLPQRALLKHRVLKHICIDDETIPLTYQQIQCHMVFDVKMEDFNQKAQFVAGGHMTETPATNTYAFVISCSQYISH
jgi:hypothetical protein